MKITASRRFESTKLNQLPGDFLTLLQSIGFSPVPSASGTYGILDDTGKDVILYDENSGEFYRIKNGALQDNGETVCSYLNDADGWEVLLEDYPELSVDTQIYSLEEALGIE